MNTLTAVDNLVNRSLQAETLSSCTLVSVHACLLWGDCSHAARKQKPFVNFVKNSLRIWRVLALAASQQAGIGPIPRFPVRLLGGFSFAVVLAARRMRYMRCGRFAD
eukprot:2014524-Amphidinium_carterae.1